jgi:hypothetical protein
MLRKVILLTVFTISTIFFLCLSNYMKSAKAACVSQSATCCSNVVGGCDNPTPVDLSGCTTQDCITVNTPGGLGYIVPYINEDGVQAWHTYTQTPDGSKIEFESSSKTGTVITTTNKNGTITGITTTKDGKTTTVNNPVFVTKPEYTNSDGSKTTEYSDGSKTTVFASGDTSKTTKDGTIIYTYKTSGDVFVTKPDGTQVYTYKDGKVKTTAPGAEGISTITYLANSPAYTNCLTSNKGDKNKCPLSSGYVDTSGTIVPGTIQTDSQITIGTDVIKCASGAIFSVNQYCNGTISNVVGTVTMGYLCCNGTVTGTMSAADCTSGTPYNNRVSSCDGTASNSVGLKGGVACCKGTIKERVYTNPTNASCLSGTPYNNQKYYCVGTATNSVGLAPGVGCCSGGAKPLSGGTGGSTGATDCAKCIASHCATDPTATCIGVNCPGCGNIGGGGGLPDCTTAAPSTTTTTWSRSTRSTWPGITTTTIPNVGQDGCTQCGLGGDDTCGNFDSTKTCELKYIKIGSRLSNQCRSITKTEICKIVDKKCINPVLRCVNNKCINPETTPTATPAPSSTTTITMLPTPTPITCSVRPGQPQIPCPSGYHCQCTCCPAQGQVGCAQNDICVPDLPTTTTVPPTTTTTTIPTCLNGEHYPYFMCKSNSCAQIKACGKDDGICSQSGGLCSIKEGNTYLSLVIGLDGLGTTGDNQNPSDINCTPAQIAQGCGSNKNPNNTTREVTVEFLNADAMPVGTYSGQINYTTGATNSGKFTGAIDVASSNIAEGNYIVKIKSPGYLKRQLPSLQTIKTGQVNALTETRLVTGNVNQDSSLDIMDYNILMSCSIYSQDNKTSCNLNSNYAYRSDLEDNGTIDQLDYTLLMREWVNQIEQ